MQSIMDKLLPPNKVVLKDISGLLVSIHGPLFFLFDVTFFALLHSMLSVWILLMTRLCCQMIFLLLHGISKLSWLISCKPAVLVCAA